MNASKVYPRLLVALVCMALTGLACNMSGDVPTEPPKPTQAVQIASATSTNTPTVTSSPTATKPPTSEPQPCTPRTSWIAYRVQRGESLSLLAQRAGTTTAEVVVGNCLDNPSLLEVGQVIYLPRQPVTPTPTTSPITIGILDISPSWAGPGGFSERIVPGGVVATLRVDGVRSASEVAFYLTEGGRGTTMLAIVRNPGSTVSVPWTVPPTQGNPDLFVWAQAANALGQLAGTPLVKLVISKVDTPQPVGIVSFTASPDTLDRNGTVTLKWETQNGVRVDLEKDIAANPDHSLAKNQPLTGTFDYKLPDYAYYGAGFKLTATDAQGRQAVAFASVKVKCPYTYFFPAAAGDKCPLALPKQTQAAFEPFQSGFMLWRADIDVIYVLHNNGTYSWWDKAAVQGSPAPAPETPPSGLFQPISGFGRVWARPEVRAAIGWATAPEGGYTATTQESAPSVIPSGGGGIRSDQRMYITQPDGKVVMLEGGAWRFR